MFREVTVGVFDSERVTAENMTVKLSLGMILKIFLIFLSLDDSCKIDSYKTKSM